VQAKKSNSPTGQKKTSLQSTNLRMTFSKPPIKPERCPTPQSIQQAQAIQPSKESFFQTSPIPVQTHKQKTHALRGFFYLMVMHLRARF
jgi:hypothetical protein